MLKDLTIVTLTLGRPNYVTRNMKFWSGTETTILVFDGSDSPIDKSVIEKFESNISYHHMPVSISQRLGAAEKMIRTKYAILLADDEFFVPSGLISCIAELEADMNLVSCGGRCMVFAVDIGGEIIGWPGYTENAGYSVLGSTPEERMLFHMAPYRVSTIYSVCRSKAWKIAARVLSEKEFAVSSIDELQFELAICYEGKSKVISELTWLRSGENLPVRISSPDNSASSSTTTIFQWWSDPVMQAEKNDFLDVMGKILAQSDKKKQMSVSKAVEIALDAYVNSGCPESTAQPSPKKLVRFLIASVLPILKVILPAQVKRIVKQVFLNRTSLLDAVKGMALTGVNVDFNELERINDIVLQFHTEKSP
jgi:glycosyltransferase domain-containing protein